MNAQETIEMDIGELLTYVAWCQYEFDRASADVAAVRTAMNVAVKRMKEVTGYDAHKNNLEFSKGQVVEFALKHLPEKRTTAPNIGWVDVTPQDPVAEVVNMWALLADPTAHQFIESITLTKSATTHLESGREIPGVELVDTPPKVRMSVKEFLDSQKES